MTSESGGAQLRTQLVDHRQLHVADALARRAPQLFSLEMWGGATFDTAMRFLHEDPWERLRILRKAIPNILLQMLLRGANAVGYKAYPDNLVSEFVYQSWENGIDVFRIFGTVALGSGSRQCSNNFPSPCP